MSWGHWWNTLFFEASDVMCECKPVPTMNTTQYSRILHVLNFLHWSWWTNTRANCGPEYVWERILGNECLMDEEKLRYQAIQQSLNCWKYMHINMFKLLHCTMGNLCQTGWLNATYATWNEPKLDTLLHLHFWRVWHFALLAAARPNVPNVPKPLSAVRGVHW